MHAAQTRRPFSFANNYLEMLFCCRILSKTLWSCLRHEIQRGFFFFQPKWENSAWNIRRIRWGVISPPSFLNHISARVREWVRKHSAQQSRREASGSRVKQRVQRTDWEYYSAQRWLKERGRRDEMEGCLRWRKEEAKENLWGKGNHRFIQCVRVTYGCRY